MVSRLGLALRYKSKTFHEKNPSCSGDIENWKFGDIGDIGDLENFGKKSYEICNLIIVKYYWEVPSFYLTLF